MTTNLVAQLETSFWATGGGQLLDLSKYPPKVVGSNKPSQWLNSIADEKGQLLFYTDGASVFNQNNQLIGTSGQEHAYINVCIVPYPGRVKTYNVFFIGFTGNDISKQAYLFRTIVDLTKSGNVASTREIVAKAKNTDATNFRVIATRGANCQSYWIITTNSDTVKSYYVDKTGVRLPSVDTKVAGGGSLGILKIAPNGRRAALIEGFNNGTKLDILSFEKASGKFEVLIKAPLKYDQRFFYDLEFSSNSKNLFVAQDSLWNDPDPRIGVRSNRKLLAYFSESTTLSELTSSEKVLFNKKNQIGFNTGMQLTLTGRIYQVFTAGWGNTRISSIHNPNAQKIEDMDFQEAIPGVFTFIESPIFPSYYLEEKFTSPILFKVNAGNDSLLCRGFDVVLGKNLPANYSYEWSSTGILSKADARNPTLIASQTPKNKYDTITNIVHVYDSVCRKAIDTVKIFYKPAGSNKIFGSKSVCPGVKEVSYWIRGDSVLRDQIAWTISGGDIAKNFKDSITVNWRNTNLQAQVSALSLNKFNCPDLVAPFSVKVFKSLDTEKPKGADTLKCNVGRYEYQIQPTNNSVYSWSLLNGKIVSGNGTNKILVDWDLTKKYGKLWIEESVNTLLETCFGKSDTLKTVNPLVFGSENAQLYSISSVLDNDDTLLVNYKINNGKLFQRYSELYWRPLNKSFWSEPIQVDNSQILKSLVIGKVNQEFAFQISLRNVCDKPFQVKENSNVFLRLQKDSVNETLTLHWNKPLGWDNVSSYRIYRQKDDETKFKLYDSLPGDILYKKIANTSDGFDFKYYVTATSDGIPFKSISNSTQVSFSHEPFIPNVFTPNGDKINDYFEIEKIELYSENKLIIYNRYGSPVYDQSNYDNTWNGGGLSTGVYYYHFMTKKFNRSFFGWVQIIR